MDAMKKFMPMFMGATRKLEYDRPRNMFPNILQKTDIETLWNIGLVTVSHPDKYKPIFNI